MKKLLGFLFPLLLLLGAASTQAQTAQPIAIVVTTCGTSGFGLAGRSSPSTVNTAGQLCITGSLSPSGTQDINIVAVGGNAVTTTVPVSVTGGATSANQIATQAPVAPATATATKSDLIGAQFNTFPGTFTAGQQGSLSVDAFGALITGPDSLAVSGSVTSAATLFTQDMTGYLSASIQITSIGAGNTITFETSEDQTTWYVAVGLASAAGSTAGLTSTATALNQLTFPRYGRYFRARVSTYGSGTVTVVGSLFKAATTRGIGAQSVSGTIGSGSADSGNPVKVGGVYNSTLPTFTTGQRGDLQLTPKGGLISTLYDVSGNSITSQNQGSDGVATSGVGLISEGFGYLFNATNFDRIRSIINATNSIGTGIAAVGLVAQLDDTSPTAITENQFGNVRMAADRSLMTTPVNTAGHMSTATTTTFKSGAGILHAVCVNTLGTVASTVTVYDNTAGSGTVIGVINSLAISGCFSYDVAFATGLTLVTTGTVAPDVTIAYK